MAMSSQRRCTSVSHGIHISLHCFTHETIADVLDGGMIILTIYTLNFLHPGFLLKTPPKTSPDDFAMSVALDKTLRA